MKRNTPEKETNDIMTPQHVRKLETHYSLSQWTAERRDAIIREHTEAISLLTYARELISDPGRFLSVAQPTAATSNGAWAYPEDPNAFRFSFYGALGRAAAVLGLKRRLSDAQRSLANGAANTPSFDVQKPKHEGALAAYDAAIDIQRDNDRHDAISVARHGMDGRPESDRTTCNLLHEIHKETNHQRQ